MANNTRYTTHDASEEDVGIGQFFFMILALLSIIAFGYAMIVAICKPFMAVLGSAF